MNLGKLGIWCPSDVFTAHDLTAFAQRAEAWGYGTLWVPEALGRDALVASGLLLANTKTLNVATGIASIYARHPLTAVSGQFALAEQSGGRFLLGLGVSHTMIVEGMRGQTYEKPIPAMTRYLQAMNKAQYMAPPPAQKPKKVIAALGPKMLEVAATYADGAHPYNVTPEHTAQARKVLGPAKLLCPEQMVILETDPAKARVIARRMLAMYLQLPNYTRNFLRLGFTEQDLSNGGSDKLIDSIVAWGDEAAIRARIKAHWDAGADHVCIQSLARDGMRPTAADERIFELLAPTGT